MVLMDNNTNIDNLSLKDVNDTFVEIGCLDVGQLNKSCCRYTKQGLVMLGDKNPQSKDRAKPRPNYCKPENIRCPDPPPPGKGTLLAFQT